MTAYQSSLSAKLSALVWCALVTAFFVLSLLFVIHLGGSDFWAAPLYMGGVLALSFYDLCYRLTQTVQVSSNFLEIRSFYSRRQVAISQILRSQASRNHYRLRLLLNDSSRITIYLNWLNDPQGLLQQISAAGVPRMPGPAMDSRFLAMGEWIKAHRCSMTGIAILIWAASALYVHPLWSAFWPALALVFQFGLPFSRSWNPRYPRPVSRIPSCLWFLYGCGVMPQLLLIVRNDSWYILSNWCGFFGACSVLSYARVSWRRHRRAEETAR